MLIDKETGELQFPFVRSAYNYDMDQASRESGQVNTEPTKAQQQFKEECDINTLVERFHVTGELPNQLEMPADVDFSEGVTDYQTALNMVIEARDAFMKLPAAARTRFNNDPQALMAFLADRSNLEEARKLGLAVPAPEPEPPPKVIPVRVIPDEPKPA